VTSVVEAVDLRRTYTTTTGTREIVAGSSIVEVAGLLGAEALIGTIYAVAVIVLLRRFEVIARQDATLEVA
jgi:hypothetical protein